MRIGIALSSQRLKFFALHLSSIACVATLAGCNAVVHFDDFTFESKKDDDSHGGGGGRDKDSGTPPDMDASTQVNDSGPPCVPNQIPETSCSGGIDNDCDGHIDCDDSDCAASPMCCTASGVEVGSGACSDGIDNDCDGLKDCQETACAAQASCCNATGDENTASACSDGADNDCDGLKDCLDPDCGTLSACCTKASASETDCNDNLDDDCDGNVDCRDSDCSSATVCTSCVKSPPGALLETSCSDRIDNDCDLDKDCRDPDCAGQLACCVASGPENDSTSCVDDVDNDCDGMKDCADPDCASQLSCCVATPENTAAACGDLIDNDCDGVKDCADPSCAGIGACCVANGAESGATACGDRMDNDCDGKVDCQDPDCAGVGACACTTTTGGGGGIQTLDLGGGSICCTPDGMDEAAAPNDGKDNDCDGLTDIPVLSSAFPTQGLPTSADEVRLSFMTEIDPGAVLSCRTHRPNDTAALWSACPMSGTTVKPFSSTDSGKPENNGLWVTDVRWDFISGAHSDVYTFKYYVHHTLNGVTHCAQPYSDANWFMKARERLVTPDAGSFKLGVDTFLASPFIKVSYKIPISGWKDWQLDGALHAQQMPSLRRRFTLSTDGKLLLITRNYTATRSGSCYAASFKIHNTQKMKGPVNPRRFVKYSCRAIVLNRAGAGVCMNESGMGPLFPPGTDSHEVFANALGWDKANKFMWRILLERKTSGPVNFMPKCDGSTTCNGIFLPDRAAFPQ